MLDQPLREVVVSALPDSLPDHIEVDVSELQVGDSLTVADISVPEGVTITSEPDTVVASVLAPTVESEDTEDEDGAAVEGEPEAGAGETSDE